MASVLNDALEWRCVGPFRGGRVVAVAGDPLDPGTFYFGACAGGVWKSTDGGAYWENISDGYFNTASVGAIAVAESDPNVVYAGTGEACIRVDVSHGDGIYRSTDRGATWEHLGLEDTRHIARVRVHPNDPELVYVAAVGHAFGPNRQRGVFRSKDGGKNWEHVLFKSEDAGAADLSIDATNPRIIYASLWQGRRSPWSIASGGPNSGLHRSTDGGDTWTDLTRNAGLPDGVIGRIGVAASPARPGRVWAIVEAEHGGVFLSDDGGDTWERVNDEDEPRGRPWYYSHVFADPQDAETVWALAGKALKSNNAGRTFTEITMPHGDQHDLWIDPRNPRRMIEGNDGGACVTYNGGETWSSLYNQPTAQMYTVDVDDQVPYRMYGPQQDNSTISAPSRSLKGAILWEDCYTVGMSESGKIAVKPGDPNIVYSSMTGGKLNRYDHANGHVRIIKVWPEWMNNSPGSEYKYRFGWEFPIVVSPHDPDTLYVTGNIVFRSTDDGTSWKAISPDLTRDDKSKQGVAGPITADGGRAEIYCTIYAFAESPHDPGVFWAGTDDGLIHISRDGGASWTDVTPPDLPEWTTVSVIEPSPHDPAIAYVAAIRYKLDDNTPYLYRTADYGETWTRIAGGIPDGDFTRVIREDPARRGLLYAGTETGVYVSLDNGGTWEPLRLNLPVAPIYDLKVKDGDLVAATHGRSFWVLDDLTTLRELSDEVFDQPAYLVKPRPTTRFLHQSASRLEWAPGKHYVSELVGVPGTSRVAKSAEGEPTRVWLNAGTNPPEGVLVFYHLAGGPEGEVSLAFLDPAGQLVNEFSRKGDGPGALEPQRGMNRFVWDMRHAAPPELRDESGQTPAPPAFMGSLAVPGTYRVRLTVGEDVLEESFELLNDPRSAATQADLDEQLGLELKIRDKYQEAQELVERVRGVRRQLEEWERRAEGDPGHERVSDASTRVRDRLSAIENEIVPFKPTPGRPPRGLPMGLHGKLRELMEVVNSADWRPTRQSCEVFDDLSARLDRLSRDLQKVVDKDLRDFTGLLEELKIPAVGA